MLRAVRFCLMIEGQQGVTWKQWLALAEAAERLGFEGLFRSDHYFSSDGVGGRGSTDAWGLLAALAARTERIRLGTLVSPVTFRLPSVLAKNAATVDEVSGGRVEIGMGAGWWTEEHTQFGSRSLRRVSGSRCWKSSWRSCTGCSRRIGSRSRARTTPSTDAECFPKPVQRPRPPIVVGGKKVGTWMQRLIGAWADEFNTVGGSPDEVRERFGRARDGVAAAGREPDTLVTSMMTWCFVAPTEDEYLAKLERARSLDPTAGPFDAYRADIEADCIVGTPERAAETLSKYAAAGVQRIMLNHELYDDLEMLELLATQVFPKVEG